MASHVLLVSVISAFICGSALGSLNAPFPLESEILGQELIGPIDNYICEKDGAFAHPDECIFYVLCSEGEATLYTCTEIMLFDLRYMGCNYANYTDCGDRRRPPEFPGTISPPPTTSTVDPTAITSPTTPRPNNTFVCPDNGVFPHPKCEYYWNCWNGEAILTHCELNYLYDLKFKGCNFPQYVDCGDRERPEGSPSTVTPPDPTTQKPTGTTPSSGTTLPGNNTSTVGPTSSSTERTDFECPEPQGVFPDPKNCEAFYTCIESIPIHEFCPDNLQFNPVTKVCDWPSVVKCEI